MYFKKGAKIMNERFLRRAEIVKITGLSKSTLHAKVKAGIFPQPVKLSKRAK